MLIILFGLSGSGKNYVAEIIAQQFHFQTFDADSILPQIMRDCIAQKQMFTQVMRDHFTQLIINKINVLQASPGFENLVVTQALYKEKNRAEVQAAFPEAKFICVGADINTIQARLQNNHSTMDANYAKAISVNFETPHLVHIRLTNNANQAHVESQLEEILTSSPKIHRSMK